MVVLGIHPWIAFPASIMPEALVAEDLEEQ